MSTTRASLDPPTALSAFIVLGPPSTLRGPTPVGPKEPRSRHLFLHADPRHAHAQLSSCASSLHPGCPSDGRTHPPSLAFPHGPPQASTVFPLWHPRLKIRPDSNDGRIRLRRVVMPRLHLLIIRRSFANLGAAYPAPSLAFLTSANPSLKFGFIRPRHIVSAETFGNRKSKNVIRRLLVKCGLALIARQARVPFSVYW
ncbi:hypothetical protein BDV93DRAFT_562545 [Ceratobasidium sp. AG-I]|nr:hypothetical protein BDV93DRAFT_562545 [Ceratobasidium sp. AG-I]